MHIDHAINILGSDWLVIIVVYSKYSSIHPKNSTSTKSTIQILEQEFSHFGYPHSIVTDNATTFTSDNFQKWCSERGIFHLTGAQYLPSTNGIVERLVKSF